MNFKKELGSVAEAVKKVMEAELSPKQKAIAKMAEPKHKIDGADLAKLRAGHKPVKEESEQIDEVKMADLPSRKIQGRGPYGSAYSKPEPHAIDTLKGPKEKELKDIEAKKNKKKFNEMVEILGTKGLKGIKEAFEKEEVISEEPDNEQFTKEVEIQKKKNAGTASDAEKAKVAAASVQSVEVQKEETHTQVQVVDLTDPYNIKKDTIDLEERHMTEPEMEKREKIVKSMKKGLAGFKQRYGERAKNVMYATATKQAMKD